MITKKYKLINNTLGWALGVFASAIYIITAEPTASWWDCGEYIATTYKMLIGHPPGAPMFQIIGRFFTLFAGGDVTKVAFCVNVMSAICSGLTIMFLFWSITMLGRKLVKKMGEMTPGREIALFGSALVGSLTYTFSDTFWFSAAEGEVYAMSSFFTALVFWCILKWDVEYDNPKPNVNPARWIILIAYLIGLSIGVHLLNLLTLPAIVLVIYFKLSKEASHNGVILSLAIISFFVAIFFSPAMMVLIWLFVTIPLFYFCIKKKTIQSKAEWGVFLSLIGSFILLGSILYGIVPQIVNLAGKFEIFFINTIRLPFNTGTIIYFLLIFAFIGYGIYYSLKKKKTILFAGVFSFFFILVGYSTFLTLIIRSNANPTIDQNNPDDAVALLAYLNREQYGSHPLIYGQTYNSTVINAKDRSPVYIRDDASRRYIISDHRKNTVPIYRENVLFPRMWSYDKADEYVRWLKKYYDPNTRKGKDAIRHLDRNKIPTHAMNVKFMQTYQLNHMYFRYFMWNFAGRQNDMQGYGDQYNGNWVSGIPFIDNALVGEQANLPPSMERPGHNTYYLLPLLLGLIGLAFYSMRDLKNSFIVLLLFAMTGLAIAFYLNMHAFQPRERDYAFAASFYAFSIWIGFGVFGIYSLFEKIKNNRVQVSAAIAVTLLCTGLVPSIMAHQNWDDHDRSHRYTALAFAKNYLDSCEPNAIIFTLGDNDTFPLWYAQEVEGYRTDVRVCNLSLLSAGWYVDQMKRKAYTSEPLPISMTQSQYRDGTRDLFDFERGNNEFLDAKKVMDYIKSPVFDKTRRVTLTNSRFRTGDRSVPGSFSIPVDKEKVLANGTVKPENESLIVDRVRWNLKNTTFGKAYIVMLDILAHNDWERPVYFAYTTGSEGWFGLEEYFQLEGLAYRLVPLKTSARSSRDIGRIDTDILYKNLMHTFNDHSRVDRVNNPNAPVKEPYPYLWGGLNDPRVYHPTENVRLMPAIRGMYKDLADALMKEGKIEKAEEVLDFCNVLLPNEIFPYKMTYYFYYPIVTIYFIDSYLKLGTETGKAKATKMMEAFLKHYAEEFAWLEARSDRTLEIQSENISNSITTIFLQMLYFLDNDFLKSLDSHWKQIPFDRVGTFYLNQKNERISSLMRNFTDAQAVANELQMVSVIGEFAEFTGSTVTLQRADQIIETTLDEINRVAPHIVPSIRGTLR